MTNNYYAGRADSEAFGGHYQFLSVNRVTEVLLGAQTDTGPALLFGVSDDSVVTINNTGIIHGF